MIAPPPAPPARIVNDGKDMRAVNAIEQRKWRLRMLLYSVVMRDRMGRSK